MKKIFTLLLGCIAFSSALHAQQIDKLAWMAGTWTQAKDGEVVQESWLGPRGRMMVASNLTTGKRNSFEFLRIVEKDGALAYLASPGGKAPTEFKLKELGEKKVVFENPAHDFPQRIIYAIGFDGAMKARIEGTIQGKERGMEWRFEKARP
jgi:hypothetical protein